MLSNNYSFANVKLIIWDLDNTFWSGILTEGGINYKKENIDLVKALTDVGIINSICSKNDINDAKKSLMNIGMWDYFVFPSINWEPKGQRVESIIKKMQLRAENVLYLDDEIYNLQEVIAFVPDIMVSTPDVIPTLIESCSASEKKDVNHSRLNRYKILENKNKDKDLCSDNTAFLKSSSIIVQIKEDCENNITRILELIQRTNQLNFTKKRISHNDLVSLLQNPDNQNRYVECRDKYGDYGIIGFYSLKNGELEHFLFSCRVLGMGVEQYVYSKLGYPRLEVNGDVVVKLEKNDTVTWINSISGSSRNNSTVFHKREGEKKNPKVLLKGPCDLSQIEVFLQNKGNFVTEFTYVDERGVPIENHNHTISILNSLELPEPTKRELINTIPFHSSGFFNTSFFSGEYDVIVISMLVDYGLGVYENIKNPNIRVVYEQYTIDITNPNNWNRLYKKNNSFLTQVFTEKALKKFASEYRFIGNISKEDMRKNLELIRKRINPSTCIIFINGSETPFPGNDLERKGRELVHIAYNQVLSEFCHDNANCYILDVNQFITKDKYTDTINHYTKDVYYQLAQELALMLNKRSNVEAKVKGKLYFKCRVVYGKLKKSFFAKPKKWIKKRGNR